MMPEIDMLPFLVSVKLALVTTVILLLAGIPVALILVYSKFRGKIFAEILITLPMVLPPSVLGFYLLILFSGKYGIGKTVADITGIELLFSFNGLVAASCIHSLPYMIQPIKDGMSGLNISMIEASYTLGKSRVSTLLNVILPNIKSSIFTGILMTFVHVTGEFGVVLMIGGSIPGETRVASIALFEKVESMNYSEANVYAAVFVIISILMISLLQILKNNTRGVTG